MFLVEAPELVPVRYDKRCSIGSYAFMTDTMEAKTSNMETRSALPPE
jgi:hypothetical protein